MKRVERLINLIAALLDTERPMTAEQIRSEIAGYDQTNFQAFRRAFERDKHDLRELGIPIEAVSNPSDPFNDQADAYTIRKDRYYLPDLDLEDDELAALTLAADAVLGAGEEAVTGLRKLAIDRDDLPPDRGRVVWGADLSAGQPLLAEVYAALVERSPVGFAYERHDGTTSERTVEPYGLVHKRGRWYLVGRDTTRGEPRSFRLDRVRGAVMRGSGSYEIPADFDAAEHLAGEAFAIGPDPAATAVVWFSERLRWWAERSWPHLPVRDGKDGGIEIEIEHANVEGLVSWALAFGTDVEIVAPPEARAAMLARLEPFLGSR